MRGRPVPLSLGRRIIVEICHFADRTQKGVIKQRLSLLPLVSAMNEVSDKPRWSVVFVKAFGLVSAEMPELRRSYVKLPWPHLYETPQSVASLAMTRDRDGEETLFLPRIRNPESQSLLALDATVSQLQTTPIDDIRDFRRLLRLARMPFPLRRWLFWLGLNYGRARANYFGTFGVTSIATAEITYAIHPLTTVLSYGRIGEDGCVDVTLSFDHRVFDGMTIAKAFAALERVLREQIAAEVAAMAK